MVNTDVKTKKITIKPDAFIHNGYTRSRKQRIFNKKKRVHACKKKTRSIQSLLRLSLRTKIVNHILSFPFNSAI